MFDVDPDIDEIEGVFFNNHGYLCLSFPLKDTYKPHTIQNFKETIIKCLNQVIS